MASAAAAAAKSAWTYRAVIASVLWPTSRATLASGAPEFARCVIAARAYGNGEHVVDAARALVDQVLGTERLVRRPVSAWPVFDGAFRRALVVRAA